MSFDFKFIIQLQIKSLQQKKVFYINSLQNCSRTKLGCCVVSVAAWWCYVNIFRTKTQSKDPALQLRQLLLHQLRRFMNRWEECVMVSVRVLAL